MLGKSIDQNRVVSLLLLITFNLSVSIFRVTCYLTGLKMNLRRDLAPIGIFLVYLFQKIKYTLIMLLYPFLKGFVIKFFEKKGVKFVKDFPENDNEIRIIDERGFCSSVLMNPLKGIMDSLDSGHIQVKDTLEYLTSILKVKGLVKFGCDEIYWLANTFNLQRGTKAWEISNHYNLGNDLFESMLDPYMQYTCAYWRHAKDLNQAQQDKLELIAKKIQLKPGMKVLDIGCGFGGLAKYFAQKFGAHVVGVTIAKEGAEYCRALCEGLPVEIIHGDLFDVTFHKEFDRIVSIGLMEHIGKFNYRDFFKLASKALKDDGILFTHAIGVHSNFPTVTRYSHDYLFPNSMFLQLENFVLDSKQLFVVEDIQNLRNDYRLTIQGWKKNFKNNWHRIQHKYGDPFYTFWTNYLHLSEALFNAKAIQLYQVVYSKKGIEGGYYAAR